jgi:hypothetical protein
MIVKRFEEADKCPVEKVGWELAAALFLTPEASRAFPSFWNDDEWAVKLIGDKGKTIGYWRREP